MRERAFSWKKISVIGCLLAFSYWPIFGCMQALQGFGIGGRYLGGKEELTRRGGNLNQAIAYLESVVRENPLYEDSLTLLGRAYYNKGRYGDAKQILQRALVVNKEDEIAWLVFGITQLRLGEDRAGLEAVKGGLTLLGKAMEDGYRGFPTWDPNRQVRSSLRRAIFLATKGLEEKENLVRSIDSLIVRIDDEEWYQRGYARDKKFIDR
jgi:tetratricopeptide (TPR) repeat protein